MEEMTIDSSRNALAQAFDPALTAEREEQAVAFK
jgi:hypothetical protein